MHTGAVIPTESAVIVAVSGFALLRIDARTTARLLLGFALGLLLEHPLGFPGWQLLAEVLRQLLVALDALAEPILNCAVLTGLWRGRRLVGCHAQHLPARSSEETTSDRAVVDQRSWPRCERPRPLTKATRR